MQKIIPWTTKKTVLICTCCITLVIIWYFRFFQLPSTIGIFDWKKDAFIFEYLHYSLKSFGIMPSSFFWIPSSVKHYPSIAHTTSYLANPETMTLFPTVPFLSFMSPPIWFRFHSAILITTGVIGVTLTARSLALSFWSSIILVLLLVLSPWQMQHIAIGYSPWIGVNLVFLSIGLFMTISRPGPRYFWSSVLISLLVWCGAFHIFVWTIAALVCFSFIHAFVSRSSRPLYTGGAVTTLATIFALPRLLVSALAFGGWTRIPTQSYNNLKDLWGLLTDNTANAYDLPSAYNIYGTALYDGQLLVGNAFLLVSLVAVIWWLFSIYKRGVETKSVTLLLSTLSFVILGWHGVWKRLITLVPLLNSEIYPYRFLFVAYLFFATFIVIQCYQLCRVISARWGILIGGGGMIILAFIPLSWHSYLINQKYINIATSIPWQLSIPAGTKDEAIVVVAHSLRDYLVYAVFLFLVIITGIIAHSPLLKKVRMQGRLHIEE